jgi:hypothetical protein
MTPEGTVRDALRQTLLNQQRTIVRTVDEFWLPPSHERADIAVIGRLMTAFEIKSEQDTLRRLPRQADAYGRVFDRCTAVVAQRHREGAMALLPAWWGVTTVSVNGHVIFEEVRKARPNPTVDPEVLVRLLWRAEASAALAALGQPQAKTASRSSRWRALIDAVALKELRTIVRRALLTRSASAARIPSRRFTQPSEVAGAGP